MTWNESVGMLLYMTGPPRRYGLFEKIKLNSLGGTVRMRRTVISVAIALAAGLGLIAFPGAAQAGTGACPSGYLCLWEDYTYNGARGQFYGTNKDLRVIPKSTGGS